MLFGGNKTRHNEFLMADAVRERADLIVWGAGVQSNNCRQTAAACAKLGLDCYLILSRAAHDDEIQGNLLLDHLMGAKVEIVDEPLGPGLDDLLLARAAAFRADGRRPYVWDRVKGRPLAAISYALCLAEIVDQMTRLGKKATHIYSAAAGATGAGMALGKSVLGLTERVCLACPIRWPWNVREDLAEVANAAAALMGLPHRLRAEDIEATEDYIGPGYGKVTAGGLEAMDLLARTEGVLLDPVYTGKAMHALIEDVRHGRLTRDDTVVFIHTGGVPAVFAYRDELMQHLRR
jgi:1-aminocyclopropane-1-carboxylate deaminase/D-cysteine desulfhydrase-like pyridoxal-dependent ACC family enzyme